MRKIWKNGEIFDSDSACISIGDRGFLLGDGAFETVYVNDYKPEYFALHLSRLRSTLSMLKITCPVDDMSFARAVTALLQSNGLKSAAVRITVTRGVGVRGLNIDGAISPTVVITAASVTRRRPPAKIAITRYRRNETCILSTVKTLGYLPQIMALQEAKSRGYTEALLLNSTGNICCASVANIFFLRGKCLLTPDVRQGCLAGITRLRVIHLAKQMGLTVKQCQINIGEIKVADAVFLTNSLIKIQSVATIEDVCYNFDDPYVKGVIENIRQSL